VAQASLEDILAFMQLEDKLDLESQESLLKEMGTTREEMNNRLKGKNMEDEFLLILLFMGVCEKMSAFDEGVSKLLGTKTPDFIVDLKNGEKLLLEIKSTEKEKFKISMGNLKKRIDYAKGVERELYFAIKMFNMWLLYPATYLEKNRGKIKITDINNSHLDKILGVGSYVFPSNLKIRSIYEKDNNKKGLGVKFDPYGELTSYELWYEDKRIIRVRGKKSPYLHYMFLLEALQDRLANIEQDIDEVGDITIIKDCDNGVNPNIISEYSFLLSPIMHSMKDNRDVLNTASSFVSELKSTSNKIPIKDYRIGLYRAFIKEVAGLGIPIQYIKNGEIYNIHQLGGNK